MLKYEITTVDIMHDRVIVQFVYDFITSDGRVLKLDNVSIEYYHKSKSWALEIYNDVNESEPHTLFSREIELFTHIAKLASKKSFQVLYAKK